MKGSSEAWTWTAGEPADVRPTARSRVAIATDVATYKFEAHWAQRESYHNPNDFEVSSHTEKNEKCASLDPHTQCRNHFVQILLIKHQSMEDGFMRSMLSVLAATAFFIGTALAQDNPPASPGADTTTGSSNNAVNPNGNATSGVNASGTVNVVAPSALEKGANSFTEGQARARIESAGFTGLSGLHKDDQGVWRGKATRNGQQTDVGFDYKGNIGAQ